MFKCSGSVHVLNIFRYLSNFLQISRLKYFKKKSYLYLFFFLVVGPDMMMYDDFTNEDVGNVIMDADYGNNTLLDTDDEHAVFRSIRPERLIGRKNRRKRKRNKNKAGVSRRRPGKLLWNIINWSGNFQI